MAAVLFAAPGSTVCRPIMMLLAEKGIEGVTISNIDLQKGEHQTAKYKEMNPNGLIPTYKEGDWLLTESSAILKYLAKKHMCKDVYPDDLKSRARVNERMDWFNTQLYRELGYHMVYPQLYDHHRRSSDQGTKETIEFGLTKAQASLAILEAWLSCSPYVAGDTLTIADYFGWSLVSLSSLVDFSFKKYPHIEQWLDKMKAMPSYKAVYGGFESYKAFLQKDGKKFINNT